VGGYVRHYYDLFQLSQQPEVLAMLRSEEYAAIKKDYDEISRTYFAKSYFWPDDMCFAKSEALFPPEQLSRILAAEYEKQCQVLCYGPFPSWAEVRQRFLEIQSLL
jgi:hypothetical protein